MTSKAKDTKFNTKKTAVCGVLSAAAVVVLFLSGLIGIGIYAGPYLASFALVFIQTEYGNKTALSSYFVTSVIALMIVPDRELSLFYLFFGWYPVLVPWLGRIKSKALRLTTELAVYFACVFLMYGLIMKLLGLNADMAGESVYLIAALVILGAGCFLITGKVYTRFAVIWKKKLRYKIRL